MAWPPPAYVGQPGSRSPAEGLVVARTASGPKWLVLPGPRWPAWLVVAVCWAFGPVGPTRRAGLGGLGAGLRAVGLRSASFAASVRVSPPIAALSGGPRGLDMASMREHLEALEGASEHSGEWLEGIVTALAGQGAHTVSDLDGAVFEDFEFPPATLTGAAKRLVRKAIEKATAAPNVVPQTPGTLGAAPSSDGGAAATAATAATAALAALLQKEDKKKEEALAAGPSFRWPAPPRARAGCAHRHRALVGRGAPRPLAAGVLAEASAARLTAPARIEARPRAAPK